MKYKLIVGGKEYEIESGCRIACTIPIKEIIDSDTNIVMREHDKDKPNVWDDFIFSLNEDILFNNNPYAMIELKNDNHYFKLYNAEIRWMRTINKITVYKIIFQNLEVC